jgi:hypothetical protein
VRPRQEGHLRAILALALALALGSCGGEDTFSPTVETVAGSYTGAIIRLVLGKT